MEHAQARPDYDQRADETGTDGGPAFAVDVFAEQHGAQHGDDEGRDEGYRNDIGQRHVADRKDEAGGRDHGAQAAHDLQSRRDAFHQHRALVHQDYKNRRNDAQLPRQRDLRGVEIGGQDLGDQVAAGEREESRGHQADAAQIVIRPRTSHGVRGKKKAGRTCSNRLFGVWLPSPGSNQGPND